MDDYLRQIAYATVRGVASIELTTLDPAELRPTTEQQSQEFFADLPTDACDSEWSVLPKFVNSNDQWCQA